MCCLRYEHEFYVQSASAFQEGKIVVTRSRGEVVSVDIPRAHHPRGVEGETRLLRLADFKRRRELVGALLPSLRRRGRQRRRGIRPDEIIARAAVHGRASVFVPPAKGVRSPGQRNDPSSIPIRATRRSAKRRWKTWRRRGRGGET